MGTPRNMTKPRSRAYRSENQGIRASMVQLPAHGCTLPIPAMPKPRKWSTAEKARWKELWESPQATQWDETVKGTVALLVTYESRLLNPDDGGAAWIAQEARHAAEALGLTPKAMTALGWAISDE